MSDLAGREKDVTREEFDALTARVKVIEDAIVKAAEQSDDLVDDVGDAAEDAVRRGLKKLFG